MFKFLVWHVLLIVVSCELFTEESGYLVDYAPRYDNYRPKDYQFSYGVSDPHTGDHKSQWEVKENGVVRGAYSLLEPDGTTRLVEYIADHDGFRAVVQKLGTAIHPEPVPVVPQQHLTYYGAYDGRASNYAPNAPLITQPQIQSIVVPAQSHQNVAIDDGHNFNNLVVAPEVPNVQQIHAIPQIIQGAVPSHVAPQTIQQVPIQTIQEVPNVQQYQGVPQIIQGAVPPHIAPQQVPIQAIQELPNVQQYQDIPQIIQGAVPPHIAPQTVPIQGQIEANVPQLSPEWTQTARPILRNELPVQHQIQAPPAYQPSHDQGQLVPTGPALVPVNPSYTTSIVYGRTGNPEDDSRYTQDYQQSYSQQVPNLVLPSLKEAKSVNQDKFHIYYPEARSN